MKSEIEKQQCPSVLTGVGGHKLRSFDTRPTERNVDNMIRLGLCNITHVEIQERCLGRKVVSPDAFV